MKNFTCHLALTAVILLSPIASASAANVPCEEALKDLRAAETSAKMSEADKSRINELEAKGVERCNADDDKRADEFFSQAMKILGK